MTQTVVAELSKPRIQELPSWELVGRVGPAARAASRALPEPADALVTAMPARWWPPLLGSWLRSQAAALLAWLNRCADRYADAAAYEELSRLSDTQLKHRGLSRDILARDLSSR
jgi:hypothetical protein